MPEGGYFLSTPCVQWTRCALWAGHLIHAERQTVSCSVAHFDSWAVTQRSFRALAIKGCHFDLLRTLNRLDSPVQLNARFVGGEPDAEGVSGTWMDAISVFWASEKGKRHTLVVAIDQSKDFLVEDCYQILVDGNVVEVKPVRKLDRALRPSSDVLTKKRKRRIVRLCTREMWIAGHAVA